MLNELDKMLEILKKLSKKIITKKVIEILFMWF